MNYVPTHQSVIDEKTFVSRREALFRDLGIPLQWTKGKKVLEFGPGGAYNARAILRQSPAKYHFVDGLSRELALREENLQEGYKGSVDIQFFRSLFMDFQSKEKYDLVLAEACIPGQDDPSQVLEKLSESVSTAGFIVITNTSKTSLISEILRSVIGKWLRRNIESNDELLKCAISVFEQHLKSLGANTRSTHDWVIDNIIHPWHLGKSDFTVLEAASRLASLGFIYHSGSPLFFRDFTWYKSPEKHNSRLLPQLELEFRDIELLLFDYRVTLQDLGKLDLNNSKYNLIQSIEYIFDLAKSYLVEESDLLLVELLDCAEEIAGQLYGPFEETARALKEFSLFPKRYDKHSESFNFRHFLHWWGRGQQYNSFQRQS